MKALRMLTAIFLLGVITFCACTAKTPVGNPFSVFSGGFSAGGTLVFNGVTSNIDFSYTTDEIKITFSSPKTLEGYVLSGKNGEYTLSYDGISVPIGAEVARIPAMLTQIFSAKNEDISSIKATEKDGKTLTEISAGRVIYAFSSDGIPVSVNGTVFGGIFSLELTGFKKA